jgi:hypothetical protein
LSKILIINILWGFLLLSQSTAFGQVNEKKGTAGEIKNNPLQGKRNLSSTVTPGTLPVLKDSISADSLKTAPASGFDAEVDYTADDFITIVQNSAGNKVLLSKKAMVRYKDIELKADYIELNRDSNVVFAIGKPDSAGVITGKPIFNQGDQKFEADQIRYNFKTKKGIVFGVVTEKDGGYIHAGRTKLINDSTYCLRNGKYTTCNAPHPHFYLEMTKAKVLSNKKIVTGPAYLVVEDMPIYFVFIPFGFFPNSSKYSSGILIPSYGEEVTRGFFLRDFGYYWAANDYFDAALKGDIYSLGSRGIKFHTNYKVRYRYSGSFDMQYYKNVFGDKGLPDYSTENDFAITWNHSLDPKASPSQTFSASVDFSTSQYDQNNSYTTQNYLTNTKQSSISYSKNWQNSPFSMSASFRHSQNSRDSTISLTLPQLTFNVTRIYPFKPKISAGPEKWYEKIGITYSMDMQNTINTKESLLFGSSLIKDWKNGIKQSIPISTSFKALKYITISPSFSYNERWYTQQIRKAYNEQLKEVVNTDTIYGFTRDYDYAVSVGASTKIYGTFTPLNPKSSIKGIRHVMTPSLTFSYRPDFSNPIYGMYENIEYYDANGRPVSLRYPVHEGGLYGTAGAGRSGSIGFSLSNTLEMKKLNIKDTSATAETYKKIKLLDQLSVTASYNLAADSFNMSNINVSARTKVAGIDVNFGAIFDPYAMENGRLINKYEFSQTGKLARLTSANLSFGLSFNSKADEEKKKKAEASTEATLKAQQDEERLRQQQNAAGVSQYADFSAPWDLRMDYSLRYNKPNPVQPAIIVQTLDFNGNVSLTKQWKVGFNSGLDIQKMMVTFTQFNIFRDLHCMQMSLNLIPFGYRQSYMFTLHATSALLKDLKITKQESPYDTTGL